MSEEYCSTHPIDEWDMENFSIRELYELYDSTNFAYPVSGDAIAVILK